MSEPAAGSNKLEAVMALLRLLTESGIVDGAFEADDLFELKLGDVEHALKTLFAMLK